MPSLPPKRATKLDADILVGKAVRYLAVNAEAKPLDAEKKDLSAELKELLARVVPTADDKGGRSYEGGGVRVSVSCPKSNKIDDVAAIKLLTAKGILDRCTKKVVDEAALQVAFQEGLLDIEDINKISTEVLGTPRIDVRRV